MKLEGSFFHGWTGNIDEVPVSNGGSTGCTIRLVKNAAYLLIVISSENIFNADAKTTKYVISASVFLRGIFL